jgi:hypothetical protein
MRPAIEGSDLNELVEGWRRDAATLRGYGAEPQAAALDRCADVLDENLRAKASAPLTLKAASELGGFSPDHLGRLIREGKIDNAGRLGAPRIRHVDVPMKRGRVAPSSPSVEVGREQIVRSVINEGVE